MTYKTGRPPEDGWYWMEYDGGRTPNEMVKYAMARAGLTPLQAYVVGKVHDGWRHREIADQLGFCRSRVTKIYHAAMRQIRLRVNDRKYGT